MDLVKIKPAPGRLVLMPERDLKPLPDDGAEVVLSAHYRRALKFGDVVVVGNENQKSQDAPTHKHVSAGKNEPVISDKKKDN